MDFIDLARAVDILDRTLSSKGTLSNALKGELRFVRMWIESDQKEKDAEIAR